MSPISSNDTKTEDSISFKEAKKTVDKSTTVQYNKIIPLETYAECISRVKKLGE